MLLEQHVTEASGAARIIRCVLLRLPEQLGSLAAVATRVSVRLLGQLYQLLLEQYEMEAAEAAPFSCVRWWLPDHLGSVGAGAARVGGCRSSSDQLIQREVEAAGAAQLSCCSDNAVE